jgi:hypothetical protein
LSCARGGWLGENRCRSGRCPTLGAVLVRAYIALQKASPGFVSGSVLWDRDVLKAHTGDKIHDRLGVHPARV